MFRRRRLLVAAVLIASASSGTLAQRPDVLLLAGGLNCLAKPAAKETQPDRTLLSCEFRRMGPGNMRVRYDGEMSGSKLYLVEPGTVRLLWNVMAPTRELRHDALEGTYDVSSRQNYALAEKSENVLFGGLNGSVALALAAPAVDAIDENTTLVLRRAP